MKTVPIHLRRPRFRTLLTLLLLAVMFLPTMAMATDINGRCYSHPIHLGVGAAGLAEAPLVTQANLQWVRLTIRWRDIQTGPTTWDWGPMDNLINAHYAQGHHILAILSTAPVWAGSNANGTRPVGTAQDTSLWDEFVRRVAGRYAGKVDAYEIWNEPDLYDQDVGVGWAGPLNTHGDPNQLPYYALYVKKASNKIRANAPGTLVVAPGTKSRPDSTTVAVWKSLETYNVAPYMDVASFHANGWTDDSSSDVWSRINSQLNTLRNRNPSNLNKPIWITEFGWSTEHNGESGQRDKIATIAEKLTMDDSQLLDCYYNNRTDIDRTFLAFIHTLKDFPGFTRGIYYANDSPKAVVTQYLQTLPTWGIEPAGWDNSTYRDFTVSCSFRTCTFRSGYDDGSFLSNYDWDFGDGTTGTGATVTHTYVKTGRYHVFHGASHLIPDPDPWGPFEEYFNASSVVQVP